jgi:hypothetical protein
LEARKAPRLTGLLRMKAAVPRSSSRATAPIATRMAAIGPNWLRFFTSWSTASAAVGVGTVSWMLPPARLTSSGV